MAPTETATQQTALNSKQRMREAFQLLLNRGTPLSTSLGLTQKHLDTLYLSGYNLYGEKKYQEALNVFQIIAIYNHLDKRGWIGSGACYQMLHRYQNALACYANASLIDIEDPVPLFYAAECYMTLKRYSEAEATLNVLHPLVQGKPQFEQMNNGITKLEELLRNE